MKLRYSFSDKAECSQIHEYSLDILKNTGIKVHSSKARNLLVNRGAKVVGQTIFISEKMVAEALKTVPNCFSLQTPAKKVTVGEGTLCKLPIYGAVYVNRNRHTGLAKRQNFIEVSKLNHMNDLSDLSCPYSLEPSDIPIDYRDRYKMLMTLKYSDKPTYSITHNFETAKWSIDLVKKFYDDKDHYLLIGNVNLSSPLIMGEGTGDVIIAHGVENQPIMIACGSGLSGLTAPPMPASNYLMNNAAVLAGVVLSQIVRPGLPIIYGIPLFGTDPYTASIAMGEATTALFTMMAAEMGRYYGIPSRAGGNFTDSSTLDYQSGFESFMNLFSCVFSGVDCIMHTFGTDNGMNTFNYNKYILDEYLFLLVEKYLKGLEINDVSLMPEEIKKTGCDGNYINIRNLKLIRKQYKPYPYHAEDGNMDSVFEKTNAIIKERLENYKEPELTLQQKRIIERSLPETYID